MYFNDMTLHESVSLNTVPVDRNDMMDFARKFDNVPLHTDEEFAKKTHFGDIIAPGVFSFMLMWAEYLKKDFFGEELLAGKSTKIEWAKPVFADDKLHGEAFVSALNDRNAKNGIAEVTINVYNQNDELVLFAVTEAIVKKRL